MDPERLGRLIDGLAAALELYARPWCDAPEDVVQEAFVKLAAQARPPSDPAAWLFRAVRNGAINEGIARQRRRRHEGLAATKAGWFESDASARHGSAVDPESAQAALEGLPVDQREVIVARLWGGLTFEQIADVAGTSSSSVHRLYHVGLTALRERLGVACRPNPSRSTPT
jgi:RNA polymerase sigma factor (sigma-70 family)